MGLTSYALIFLFMAFPMVLMLLHVKIFVFMLVLILAAAGYFTGLTRLSYKVALWTVGLAIVSFGFFIEGLFMEAPGASNLALVYVFWPIVYTCWIAGLADRSILSGMHHTIVIATFFIGLYGCLYLLTQLNILPGTTLVSALSMGWDAEAFSAHDGYTQMQFAGLNSLPFLLPYTLSTIFLRVQQSRHTHLWTICHWSAAALGLVVAITSYRRALVVVIALTPFLILLFRRFQPDAERSLNRRRLIRSSVICAAGVVLGAACIGSIYQFDIAKTRDRMVTGFDLSSQTLDLGAAERQQQLSAFWDAWLDRPFLGSGLGAILNGRNYFRTEILPWGRYEMYYADLLFQTGLLGITAYSAGVAWMFWCGIKIIREGGELGRRLLPLLVGCSAFLIANATNPYLARFDGLWILFLPLAVVNYRLVTSSPAYSDTQNADGV
jgi:hypothetical protein